MTSRLNQAYFFANNNNHVSDIGVGYFADGSGSAFFDLNGTLQGLVGDADKEEIAKRHVAGEEGVRGRMLYNERWALATYARAMSKKMPDAAVVAVGGGLSFAQLTYLARVGALQANGFVTSSVAYNAECRSIFNKSFAMDLARTGIVRVTDADFQRDFVMLQQQ
jgi:hypothetical protein